MASSGLRGGDEEGRCPVNSSSQPGLATTCGSARARRRSSFVARRLSPSRFAAHPFASVARAFISVHGQTLRCCCPPVAFSSDALGALIFMRRAPRQHRPPEPTPPLCRFVPHRRSRSAFFQSPSQLQPDNIGLLRCSRLVVHSKALLHHGQALTADTTELPAR